MPDQIPLFVEDYAEAIRTTVQALGGFKAVGAELKPDMDTIAAGRWLADCCNADKREKLSPSELAYIRKRARVAGVHILAAFEMRDAGYATPHPIQPVDELAELQREFLKGQRLLSETLLRIERLQAVGK